MYYICILQPQEPAYRAEESFGSCGVVDGVYTVGVDTNISFREQGLSSSIHVRLTRANDGVNLAGTWYKDIQRYLKGENLCARRRSSVLSPALRLPTPLLIRYTYGPLSPNIHYKPLYICLTSLLYMK